MYMYVLLAETKIAWLQQRKEKGGGGNMARGSETKYIDLQLISTSIQYSGSDTYMQAALQCGCWSESREGRKKTMARHLHVYILIPWVQVQLCLCREKIHVTRYCTQPQVRSSMGGNAMNWSPSLRTYSASSEKWSDNRGGPLSVGRGGGGNIYTVSVQQTLKPNSWKVTSPGDRNSWEEDIMYNNNIW